MNCPKCGGKATVKNTLHTDNDETYRKIKCNDVDNCGNVFWTIEYEVEYDDRLKKELSKCERLANELRRVTTFTCWQCKYVDDDCDCDLCEDGEMAFCTLKNKHVDRNHRCYKFKKR